MYIVNILQLKLGAGLNISKSIYLVIYLNFIVRSCFDFYMKLPNKILSKIVPYLPLIPYIRMHEAKIASPCPLCNATW